MNLLLHQALASADLPRWRIAMLAGLSPSTLSAITHGRRPATTAQRQAIAAALEKTEQELFGITEEPVGA